jgi:hypothetical protein
MGMWMDVARETRGCYNGHECGGTLNKQTHARKIRFKSKVARNNQAARPVTGAPDLMATDHSLARAQSVWGGWQRNRRPKNEGGREAGKEGQKTARQRKARDGVFKD